MNNDTIILAFQKSPLDLWARAINWWTKGPYYHAAIMLPGNDLFESVSGIGVHHIPNYVMTDKMWDVVELKPGINAVDKMRMFLINELGSPYDWKSLIWSQILKRPRSHPNAWYCSELVAATLSLNYRLPNAPCTYSPNSLNTLVINPSKLLPINK